MIEFRRNRIVAQNTIDKSDSFPSRVVSRIHKGSPLLVRAFAEATHQTHTKRIKLKHKLESQLTSSQKRIFLSLVQKIWKFDKFIYVNILIRKSPSLAVRVDKQLKYLDERLCSLNLEF